MSALANRRANTVRTFRSSSAVPSGDGIFTLASATLQACAVNTYRTRHPCRTLGKTTREGSNSVKRATPTGPARLSSHGALAPQAPWPQR